MKILSVFCLLFLFSVAICQEDSFHKKDILDMDGVDGISINYDQLVFVNGNQIMGLDYGDDTPYVIAGSSDSGYYDGGYDDALFDSPSDTAIVDDIIVVADTGNDAIRAVIDGIVYTVSSNFSSPVSVSAQENRYYYFDDDEDEYRGVYDGIVVADANGISILDLSPENDQCEYSVELGTVSLGDRISQEGTTYKANRLTDDYICEYLAVNVDDDEDFKISEEFETAVWYTFTLEADSVVTVTTCNDDEGYYENDLDTTLAVFRSNQGFNEDSCDPDFLTCVGYSDDDCEALPGYYFSYETSTVQFCGQANMVYKVLVSGYDNEYGSFKLTIDSSADSNNECSSCTCSGRDCGGSTCNGYCENQDGCDGNDVCAITYGKCIPQPDNAFCDGAMSLTTNATTFGETNFILSYFDSYDYGYGFECNFGEGAGLWYKVVGTGNRFSASTCSPTTDFDTTMGLYGSFEYSDDVDEACDNLYCLGFSDDTFDCSYSTLSSTIDWCTTDGDTYYISVVGYDEYEKGEFVLSVLEFYDTSNEDCIDYYYWYDDDYYWDERLPSEDKAQIISRTVTKSDAPKEKKEKHSKKSQKKEKKEKKSKSHTISFN